MHNSVNPILPEIKKFPVNKYDIKQFLSEIFDVNQKLNELKIKLSFEIKDNVLNIAKQSLFIEIAFLSSILSKIIACKK